jgi:hypothetical protein
VCDECTGDGVEHVKRDDGTLPLEYGEPLKRNRVGLIDDRVTHVVVKKVGEGML